MTENALEVGGTASVDRGARWILRTRRQHHGPHSWPQRAIQRLRSWSVIVDAERHRHQSQRHQQIEERGKRRVFHCHLIACPGMLAQEALDGVETAARDGDRPTRYSVGGKLGRGKRDKSRQFQRSAVEPRIRVHSSERPTDRREKGGIGIARCEIDKAGSMTTRASDCRSQMRSSPQRGSTPATAQGETARAQQPVGGSHGDRTDPQTSRELANRRQAIAIRQLSRCEGLLYRGGDAEGRAAGKDCRL